jgi:hypothetical protein
VIKLTIKDKGKNISRKMTKYSTQLKTKLVLEVLKAKCGI